MIPIDREKIVGKTHEKNFHPDSYPTVYPQVIFLHLW